MITMISVSIGSLSETLKVRSLFVKPFTFKSSIFQIDLFCDDNK